MPWFLFFTLFFLSFFCFKISFAVCPICTVAVAGGVELSRWLGVDDIIIGLWIGGLAVSLILWTESWLDKKNIKFKGRIYIDFLFYYLLIFISLYWGNLLNTSYKIFVFPKILIGIVLGSVSFWWGNEFYIYLKEKNGGRAYFPFQKVLMPIIPLFILSIIFYFLLR